MELETVTVTRARQPDVLPPEEQRTEVVEIELVTADARGREEARR